MSRTQPSHHGNLRPVLVVTHGGVILALWGAIAPGSPEAPAGDGVANGSTYVFERDADGWRRGALV